ncbi:hypothetical protein [Maricaulis sp. CAU 1757]
MSLLTRAQLSGVLLVEEGRMSDAQLAAWESWRCEPDVSAPPGGADPDFGLWIIGRKGAAVLGYSARTARFFQGASRHAGQVETLVVEADALGDLLDRVDLGPIA